MTKYRVRYGVKWGQWSISEVILVIDQPLEFRARVSLNDPAVLNPQFKSVFLPLSFPTYKINGSLNKASINREMLRYGDKR